ncbi:lipoprotein, putative [Roseobacter sp. SK209-2-6]|uniref:hypothetical protein n=1 Tax=Roseobacter sp. SK209-2-6 TaxID=388739 RepID=UPI0000F3D7D9|nr:hypothetical protein [Roseobacter sp. SK209-2-6]EBA17234.1 lipoprotein, putative [Roseobacter sp. SK209-2-6]
MRFLTYLPLSVLIACSTPDPHFKGQVATRVTIEGSTFDVRLRGNLAEALRINPEYAPRLGPLRQRAAKAMESVSGCRVSGVLGDQALMTGILNCTGSSTPTLGYPQE